jgi:hypothetical protein
MTQSVASWPNKAVQTFGQQEIEVQSADDQRSKRRICNVDEEIAEEG